MKRSDSNEKKEGSKMPENTGDDFYTDFSQQPPIHKSNPVPPKPEDTTPPISYYKGSSEQKPNRKMNQNSYRQAYQKQYQQQFPQSQPPYAPGRQNVPPQGYYEQEASYPKKRKTGRNVFLFFLILLILLVGVGWYMFSGLTVKPMTSDSNRLGIDPAVEDFYRLSGVTNIALFGVDNREYENGYGRSDAIMVVSVDQRTSQVKMSSVLRDSYVPVEGYGNDKIAHAYFYGGPELAVRTLNQNFKLNIKNYATVNFYQMTDVIDSLGGVDIEISEAERQQINALSKVDGMWAEDIPAAGLVHLNGTQATAYSRIRSIDTDSARAGRQRTVMEAMYKNVKNKNILEYPNMIRSILPMTETSMDLPGIISLSPAVLFGDSSVTQFTVPDVDRARGGEVGGSWVWQFDIPSETQRLHNFIYGSRSMY